MQTSILIVSKNRKQELFKTIQLLEKMINSSETEILIFLDGCNDGSSELKNVFPNVKWFESEKSIGASASRYFLYPKAKGEYLIGFDDDAHPLDPCFVDIVKDFFQKYPHTGIIAFEEIKGVYLDDEEALKQSSSIKEEYLVNDFIGCGFAVRKEAYFKTRGFPNWIDIYGEESCLALELINAGWDILYANSIKVNHRVDKSKRIQQKNNYFRFNRQLKNTTFYYLVYFKNPFLKILKLYYSNFKKYALKDFQYFIEFFKVIVVVIVSIPLILKNRFPISNEIFEKSKKLRKLKY